jgi:hypothetical protein
MAEERVLQHALLFPEDIHDRHSVVEHSQGNVFRRDGGEDRRLGVPPIGERERAHVVQVSMGDKNRF